MLTVRSETVTDPMLANDVLARTGAAAAMASGVVISSAMSRAPLRTG